MSKPGGTETPVAGLGERVAYWIEAESDDGPWRVMYQLPGQRQATAEVPPRINRRNAEERAREAALSYARRVKATAALTGRWSAEVVEVRELPLWATPLDGERNRFAFVVRAYLREEAP